MYSEFWVYRTFRFIGLALSVCTCLQGSVCCFRRGGVGGFRAPGLGGLGLYLYPKGPSSPYLWFLVPKMEPKSESRSTWTLWDSLHCSFFFGLTSFMFRIYEVSPKRNYNGDFIFEILLGKPTQGLQWRREVGLEWIPGFRF